MFGCLRRIGCLIILVVLGFLAWFYRDQLMGLIHRGNATAASASGVVWEPLTDAGAARARTTISTLGQRQGPVFANVHAGDLASYIFVALSKQLPPSAKDAQAAVINDKLYLRAVVNPAELGGTRVLGPMASVLGSRDTLLFGGTFEVVHPGLAEYHVQELKIAHLKIPAQLIPRVVQQIEQGSRPQGVAEDALPLVVPNFIGDVRVARGQVTLYKNVP